MKTQKEIEKRLMDLDQNHKDYEEYCAKHGSITLSDSLQEQYEQEWLEILVLRWVLGYFENN